MKVLYVGFKGANNASRQLVEKVNSSNKLFLTNSYDGIKSNLDKVDLKSYELILMFGINKNLKNKIVIEVKSKCDNEELMTTVNYKKFKLLLHENNIDVDINFKPTRYLCNYAYYLALSKNTKCVFHSHTRFI